MPLRHPAPRRSRTHVDEFRNRGLQAKFILPAALSFVILLALAEALGIEQRDWPLFLLLMVIAIVILNHAYNLIRS